MKTPEKAQITEIFSSIQGEGLYAGVPQIFLRFSGCNLSCDYCDEQKKEKWAKGMTVARAIEKIVDLERKAGPHHSLSLTGGEPLMQERFLRSLLPSLRKKRFKIYLETNGTLPDQLSKVVRYCDFIAMDLKLPSSLGNRSWLPEHRRFLKIARLKNTFVKIVVTVRARDEEIQNLIEIIRSQSTNISLVLQPVTERNGRINRRVMKKLVEKWLPRAASRLKHVRVVPQMHTIWGVA